MVHKYIKHNYKRGISSVYWIGIPIFVILGTFFGILIYVTVPLPDRPIEYAGWIIVYFGIFFVIFGGPFLIIFVMERAKKYWFVSYYRFGDDAIIIITPKGHKRKIEYRMIVWLIPPKMVGSKLENLTSGGAYYICGKKMVSTGSLETKAAFRLLLNNLKFIRTNTNDFKAIIQPRAESDDWKKGDMLKKALRKGDEKIWLDFLEEWWKKQERGKEYWLKTPLERILEDLHCPYSLEELENPSEDELVEIDESELIEEKC